MVMERPRPEPCQSKEIILGAHQHTGAWTFEVDSHRDGVGDFCTMLNASPNPTQ